MYIVRVISLIKVPPQISGADTKECNIERSSQQIRIKKHPLFCMPLCSVLVYESKRVMKIVHTLISHCFFVSYLASNVLKNILLDMDWFEFRHTWLCITFWAAVRIAVAQMSMSQTEQPSAGYQSAAAELQSARRWAPSKTIQTHHGWLRNTFYVESFQTT